MSADQFLQYLISGITMGSIYALVGLGFTLIYAVTRIINFAQGEFVMLGGMLSFYLFSASGIPLAPAIILSILVTAAVGALLYILAIYPGIMLFLFATRRRTVIVFILTLGIGIILYILAKYSAKKPSVVSLIIITIGAAVFIRGIAGVGWGVYDVRPPYWTGSESIRFFGAYIHPQALWIIGMTVTVVALLHFFLSYTMVGKALKACAINSSAASMVGINPKLMALTAFAMAAAIGGIAGAALAPWRQMAFDEGFTLGIWGFVAASIGGFKSPIVTVIGGLTLGIVISLAVGVDWGPFASGYKDAIAMMALLLILLIRSGRLAQEEREI
jgi:branched-chain amino acid transport system permease protein